MKEAPSESKLNGAVNAKLATSPNLGILNGRKVVFVCRESAVLVVATELNRSTLVCFLN